MTEQLTFFSAFIVGLFGSVHCVGMCGGIVGSLTLNATGKTESAHTVVVYSLLYNIGRISSYVVAGVFFGFLGQQLLDAIFIKQAQLIAGLVAGCFMLALGLYVAGWWRGLVRVEQLGHRLWKIIEPVGRRLLPVRTARQALMLGMLWGWLPCGMVYTALVWSLSAANPLTGAVLMLGFGLGTLPTLIVLGGFANALKLLLQKPTTRKLAGGLIVVLAFASLAWITQNSIGAASEHGGHIHQGHH